MTVRLSSLKGGKLSRLPTDFPTADEALQGSSSSSEPLQKVAKDIREAMAKGRFSILLSASIGVDERALLEAQGFTLRYWPPLPGELTGRYRLSWSPEDDSQTQRGEESPRKTPRGR